MAELEHASLGHGLLHDDVENLAHRDTVLTLRVVDVRSVDDILALMIDFQCDGAAHVLRLNQQSLVSVLRGPNVEARRNELSED